MSDDIQHKRYSPSQAERIFLCPGSSALLERAPIRRDTSYSLEGTQAHDILAAGLMNGVNTFMAAKAVSPHKDVNFSADFMSSVNDAFDYISLKFEELNSEFGDVIMFVEEFVDPPITEEPGEAGGYVDIALYSAKGRVLYVIDYKHGAGLPVDVIGNKQLKQYGSGFLYDPNSPVDPSTVDEVVLVIIQPRSFHKDGDVREHEVTPAELLEYLFELDEKIAEGRAEDAPLIPGLKQCQFCDAKTMCPAAEEVAVEAINPGAVTFKNATVANMPDPEDLTPERLAYILGLKPFITSLLNNYENYAKEQLIHGQPVPGFKMVNAQAKRTWNGDVDELAPQLAALAGCAVEDMYIKKLITITEAEKKIKNAFKKRVSKKRKKLAAEDATKQFAYFTTKESSGNLVLAPEDDARPAVNKSEQAFGNMAQLIQPPSKET